MSKHHESQRQRALSQLQKIQEQILDIDVICSGALQKRTKVCGKPSCACASDKSARHGPYYEWNRLIGDRWTSKSLSPSLASDFKRAQKNYQKLRRLLRRWEDESIRLMQTENELSRENP